MPRAVSNWLWTLAAVLAFLLTPAAYSQNPQRPQFEAASIRPGGDIFSTRPEPTPGRLVWTTQVAYLIGYAYELDMSRISYDGRGLGAIYTVNAVYPPNTSNGELRLMLQSLLADRFNLHAHREVKEVDGFALTLAKGGIKVKESDPVSPPAAADHGSGSSSPPIRENYVEAISLGQGVTEIRAKQGSFKQLTDTLGRILQRTFWDHTGLEGKYDYKFRFLQAPDPDHEAEVPSLSNALRESLGVVMEKQKGPLETLVIDQIDQPTEN